MALSEWQKEFRKSSQFENVSNRIKDDLKFNDSTYRFSVRPESAHFGHILEESYGDYYCCHTCKVLGVRY
jgi:hypothetical protein